MKGYLVTFTSCCYEGFVGLMYGFEQITTEVAQDFAQSMVEV